MASAAALYDARSAAVAAQRARLGLDRPDRWSSGAARFRADPHRPFDATLRALASYLRPDDVLIDVGGGAGRLSLPLASRCREVVNVEPAAGMREAFVAVAAAAGLRNVRCVAAPWLAAADVRGDVVLAAHVTYHVHPIQPFVAKLTAAARRQVVVLVNSVPPAGMNARLFALLHGEEQVVVPGYRELLPVLWEEGLVPEVRRVPALVPRAEPPQPSRTAAIEAALTGGMVDDADHARRVLAAHFEELFQQTAAGYQPTWRPETTGLLISWERGPNTD